MDTFAGGGGGVGGSRIKFFDFKFGNPQIAVSLCTAFIVTRQPSVVTTATNHLLQNMCWSPSNSFEKVETNLLGGIQSLTQAKRDE